MDDKDGNSKGKTENDAGVLAKALLDIKSKADNQVMEDWAGHLGIKLANESNELRAISNKQKPNEDQELKNNISNRHFFDEGIIELTSSLGSLGSSNLDLKGHYPDNNKNPDAAKIISIRE